MDEEKLQRFLKIISMIESSGGKNTEHPEIQGGIHEGSRAMGSYGLMPNTVQEMAKRMKLSGSIDPNLQQFANLPPEQMKEQLTPDVEQAYARALAERALQRQAGDEEKAAYSWLYGHNLKPEQVQERGYAEDPYVKKYQHYREQMFPELQRLIGKK